MKIISEAYRKNGNLHHAYLVEGDSQKILPEILLFLQNDLKIKTTGNPNFWKGEFGVLSIDESRKISEMQSKKAFGEENKKIFVILADSITREAQNALLKVFEEPTPNTHFFLIMRSAEVLLPTLLSRLMVISLEESGKSVHESAAKEFLSQSKTARLAFVKDFAEEISDEKKTRADAIAFLNEVERVMRKNIAKRVFTKEEVNAFQELLKFRDYLNDRAPSVKMILEYLALVLPHIN